MKNLFQSISAILNQRQTMSVPRRIYSAHFRPTAKRARELYEEGFLPPHINLIAERRADNKYDIIFVGGSGELRYFSFQPKDAISDIVDTVDDVHEAVLAIFEYEWLLKNKCTFEAFTSSLLHGKQNIVAVAKQFGIEMPPVTACSPLPIREKMKRLGLRLIVNGNAPAL